MFFNVSEYIKPDSKSRKIFKWDTLSLLEDKKLWHDLLSEKDLEINLQDIDILGHDGIIWIGFISLGRRYFKNLYTKIVLPNNENQISFIKYLGFDTLKDTLGIYFEDERLLELSEEKYKPRDNNPFSLRRIQLVNKDRWVKVVNFSTRYVTEYLVENYNVIERGEEFFKYIQPFTETIRELVLNIALHGGHEEGEGVGLVAYTPPPYGYKVLRFCCNDVGKGFQYTLRYRRYKRWIKTDKQAIIEALLYRFYNKKDGIKGLYPVLKYIRDRSGTMGIRTGSIFSKIDLSKEYYKKKFDEYYKIPTIEWLSNLIKFYEYPEIPGTHIFIDLTLPKMEK